MTPVEEALGTLDDLVKAGKIRYIGCSNFSGWHLMKSLAVSEKYGLARYVAHQAYYSLDRPRLRVGAHAAGARPESRRGRLEPAGLGTTHGQDPPRPAAAADEPAAEQEVTDMGPQVADEYVYQVVDALDAVANETGKTVPQIALNWLLQRPSVANVIIGARNEEQLRQNLGAVGWNLTPGAGRQARRRERGHASVPILASKGVCRAKPVSHRVRRRRVILMPVDLNEALEEHRRGNLEWAACVYESILAADPDQPDALYLLGVIAMQKADPGQAVQLIGRAADLRPDDAVIHANLAEAFRALGDNERTIDCYQTAVRLDPNHPDVHRNLALALVNRGDFEAGGDSLPGGNSAQAGFRHRTSRPGNSPSKPGPARSRQGLFRPSGAVYARPRHLPCKPGASL